MSALVCIFKYLFMSETDEQCLLCCSISAYICVATNNCTSDTQHVGWQHVAHLMLPHRNTTKHFFASVCACPQFM